MILSKTVRTCNSSFPTGVQANKFYHKFVNTSTLQSNNDYFLFNN